MRVFARGILPIAEIVLSLAILWPVRHELTQQIGDSIRFARLANVRRLTLDEILANVIPQRATPQQRAEFDSFEKRKWMPAVLNLPSGLIQLPYVILNSSKEEWVPSGMDVMTWRAISWPLIGVLFWWSAGRGIEAVIATRKGLIRPRVTWIEAANGAALFLFCAIAAVCLPLFGNDSRDPDFPVKLWSCGLGLWALLGGASVAAKFAQWRIERRNPTD